MPNLPITQSQHDGKPKRYDKERKSSTERGYGARWQRIRKAYLTKYPLCERCLTNRITKAAVLVHHRDRDSSNNSHNNLEALCISCHDKEHTHDRFKKRNDNKG